MEQSSNHNSSDVNWNDLDKRQARRYDEQDLPALSELSNTGICEMEAVYVSEMDADWQYSQELPNSEVSGVMNEPRSSLLKAKPSASWSFMRTSPLSRPTSPRTSRVSKFIGGILFELERSNVLFALFVDSLLGFVMKS